MKKQHVDEVELSFIKMKSEYDEDDAPRIFLTLDVENTFYLCRADSRRFFFFCKAEKGKNCREKLTESLNLLKKLSEAETV